MPRSLRVAAGGIVYHVLNRGCGRMKLFSRDGDYAAFEKIICEAIARYPGVKLLSYCLMLNHWHLQLLPTADGELSRFMFWMTMTHTQRWRHARKLVGLGPLYQGRFKSFPIQADDHFLTVARYIERNPLRAKLVRRAQDWTWCSLSRRLNQPSDAPIASLLHEWPVDAPGNYANWVNEPQTSAEELAIRLHARTGRPLGEESWQRKIAKLNGFQLNPARRGRPSKRSRKQSPAV